MKKWIGVLVTVIFLALLAYKFSGQQWRQIFLLLKNVNLLFFLGGVAGMVLSSYLQAIRWTLVLKPLGNYSAASAFASVCIGHWFNVILPIRAGEFARPYHFAQTHRLSFSSTLASTVIERILDVAAVLLLAFVYIKTFSANFFGDWGIALFFVYLLFLVLLMFIARQPALLIKAISLMPIANRHLVSAVLIDDFFKTIASFRTSGKILGVIVTTAVIWGVNLLSYWLLLKSCGLPGELTNVGASATATLASMVGHSIPSVASGLGVLNYAVVISLQEFSAITGFNYAPFTDDIVAASIVIYLAAILPDLLIGGYYYVRDRRLLLARFKSE